MLVLLSCAAPAVAAPCPAARGMTFQVVRQIHRDVPGFTEGLEFHGGALWESTGDVFGESRINRIDPVRGKVTALVNAHHEYFGEGLTFFGDHFYQMTWREHRVFVYDLKARKTAELTNPREGWGLTHDAARLIASDGSDKLFFLAPQDFHTLGSVTVMDGPVSISSINELEYVDGAVFANVFEDWRILKIAPATGCVLAVADLSGLRSQLSAQDRARVDFDGNFVLNGIAYDPTTRLFTLTGKYWPVLFTGRFEESGVAEGRAGDIRPQEH